MRIQIKGGVWKNSEDEVLKAAVMKYGLNNWSRVSSLLVRKSAKQCKARWYEWLSPFIKKTEWSRQEEEKLLHLAKLFPTQWRTIGPLIGRTAHQCLQHYERLLDQAQGRDEDDELDPRKLRPGEIDPAPETKPSRADAVDMDDDEKEMLAEARARLANTRGKKAKRKAREKMLQQNKRLASLQKRRELKNAGVNVGALRLHKTIMEYSKDVPFEQQPPKGFYEPETNHEIDLSLRSINQLEGLRGDAEFEKLRKDDNRKLKRLQTDDTPAAVAIFDKFQSRNVLKKKLTLPEPTITDEELIQIVKMGGDVQQFGDELARSVVARTPMTSNIMEEARFLAAENQLQTPLQGQENVCRQDFATPATPATFATPNPLKRLLNKSIAFESSRYGTSTPSRYTDAADSTYDDSMSEADPIGAQARMDMARLHVKASILNLPTPSRNLKVAVSAPEEAPSTINAYIEPDKEDVEREILKKRARHQSIVLSTTASAYQRGLPRPRNFNSIIFDIDVGIGEGKAKITTNHIGSDAGADENNALAREMIQREFKRVVAWDTINHPQPGGRPCTDPPQNIDIEAEFIEGAQDQLEVETCNIMDESNSNGSKVTNEALMDSTSDYANGMAYDVDLRRFTFPKHIPRSKLDAAKSKMKSEYQRHLESVEKENQSLESKYNKLTGGYRQREAAVLKDINECHKDICQLYCDLACAKLQEQQELKAANARQAHHLRLLDSVKQHHRQLQALYE